MPTKHSESAESSEYGLTAESSEYGLTSTPVLLLTPHQQQVAGGTAEPTVYGGPYPGATPTDLAPSDLEPAAEPSELTEPAESAPHPGTTRGPSRGSRRP
jgi:hypothetical protein